MGHSMLRTKPIAAVTVTYLENTIQFELCYSSWDVLITRKEALNFDWVLQKNE